MKKNELILWKFSFIQIQIFESHCMQLELNWIRIPKFNWKKRDANWILEKNNIENLLIKKTL
jgi:hypothetical protein